VINVVQEIILHLMVKENVLEIVHLHQHYLLIYKHSDAYQDVLDKDIVLLIIHIVHVYNIALHHI
jgi:hypothetical protein